MFQDFTYSIFIIKQLIKETNMKKITIIMITVCLYASTAIFAADGSWANVAGGNWEITNNWIGSAIADGAGSIAYFTNIANGNISVDSSRTIGELRTDSSAGFWVNDGPLVLDATTPIIDVSGAGFIYLNCALAGSSGYNKTGPGVLYLYNTTVSGDVNLNAGIIGLGWADAVMNADVKVNSGTVLYIGNGVDANAKSVTVNNGGQIQPYIGTASLNAPLTLNYNDAGNTFAVESALANDVISLNSNITMTANTAMAVTDNGSTININAPISGAFSLRLMGRSATTSIGVYNINAPCTYTGWTTLESWGANPRYKIGANQAFPCGAQTTEFSLQADNSSADTSVTLDLNDYTQRVSILWLKPDGAQSGHYVEITGSDKALLIVTNQLNMAAHANGAHAKITGGTVLVPATANRSWLNSPVTLTNATLILNAPCYGAASTVIEVQDGGVVEGLYYPSLTVKSGGKVSPGNSIGTLAAYGNVIMEAGSEYDWEVDAASADLLNITGNLDISAGEIIVNVIDAGSPDGSTKTLFTVTGTITGAETNIRMNYGRGVAGPEHPTIDGVNITATVTPEPGIIGLLSLLGLAILRRK